MAVDYLPTAADSGYYPESSYSSAAGGGGGEGSYSDNELLDWDQDLSLSSAEARRREDEISGRRDYAPQNSQEYMDLDDEFAVDRLPYDDELMAPPEMPPVGEEVRARTLQLNISREQLYDLAHAREEERAAILDSMIADGSVESHRPTATKQVTYNWMGRKVKRDAPPGITRSEIIELTRYLDEHERELDFRRKQMLARSINKWMRERRLPEIFNEYAGPEILGECILRPPKTAAASSSSSRLVETDEEKATNSSQLLWQLVTRVIDTEPTVTVYGQVDSFWQTYVDLLQAYADNIPYALQRTDDSQQQKMWRCHREVSVYDVSGATQLLNHLVGLKWSVLGVDSKKESYFKADDLYRVLYTQTILWMLLMVRRNGRGYTYEDYLALPLPNDVRTAIGQLYPHWVQKSSQILHHWEELRTTMASVNQIVSLSTDKSYTLASKSKFARIRLAAGKLAAAIKAGAKTKAPAGTPKQAAIGVSVISPWTTVTGSRAFRASFRELATHMNSLRAEIVDFARRAVRKRHNTGSIRDGPSSRGLRPFRLGTSLAWRASTATLTEMRTALFWKVKGRSRSDGTQLYALLRTYIEKLAKQWDVASRSAVSSQLQASEQNLYEYFRVWDLERQDALQSSAPKWKRIYTENRNNDPMMDARPPLSVELFADLGRELDRTNMGVFRSAFTKLVGGALPRRVHEFLTSGESVLVDDRQQENSLRAVLLSLELHQLLSIERDLPRSEAAAILLSAEQGGVDGFWMDYLYANEASSEKVRAASSTISEGSIDQVVVSMRARKLPPKLPTSQFIELISAPESFYERCLQTEENVLGCFWNMCSLPESNSQREKFTEWARIDVSSTAFEDDSQIDQESFRIYQQSVLEKVLRERGLLLPVDRSNGSGGGVDWWKLNMCKRLLRSRTTVYGLTSVAKAALHSVGIDSGEVGKSGQLSDELRLLWWRRSLRAMRHQLDIEDNIPMQQHLFSYAWLYGLLEEPVALWVLAPQKPIKFTSNSAHHRKFASTLFENVYKRSYQPNVRCVCVLEGGRFEELLSQMVKQWPRLCLELFASKGSIKIFVEEWGDSGSEHAKTAYDVILKELNAQKAELGAAYESEIEIEKRSQRKALKLQKSVIHLPGIDIGSSIKSPPPSTSAEEKEEDEFSKVVTAELYEEMLFYPRDEMSGQISEQQAELIYQNPERTGLWTRPKLVEETTTAERLSQQLYLDSAIVEAFFPETGTEEEIALFLRYASPPQRSSWRSSYKEAFMAAQAQDPKSDYYISTAETLDLSADEEASTEVWMQKRLSELRGSGQRRRSTESVSQTIGAKKKKSTDAPSSTSGSSSVKPAISKSSSSSAAATNSKKKKKTVVVPSAKKAVAPPQLVNDYKYWPTDRWPSITLRVPSTKPGSRRRIFHTVPRFYSDVANLELSTDNAIKLLEGTTSFAIPAHAGELWKRVSDSFRDFFFVGIRSPQLLPEDALSYLVRVTELDPKTKKRTLIICIIGDALPLVVQKAASSTGASPPPHDDQSDYEIGEDAEEERATSSTVQQSSVEREPTASELESVTELDPYVSEFSMSTMAILLRDMIMHSSECALAVLWPALRRRRELFENNSQAVQFLLRGDQQHPPRPGIILNDLRSAPETSSYKMEAGAYVRSLISEGVAPRAFVTEAAIKTVLHSANCMESNLAHRVLGGLMLSEDQSLPTLYADVSFTEQLYLSEARPKSASLAINELFTIWKQMRSDGIDLSAAFKGGSIQVSNQRRAKIVRDAWKKAAESDDYESDFIDDEDDDSATAVPSPKHSKKERISKEEALSIVFETASSDDIEEGAPARSGLVEFAQDLLSAYSKAPPTAEAADLLERARLDALNFIERIAETQIKVLDKISRALAQQPTKKWSSEPELFSLVKETITKKFWKLSEAGATTTTTTTFEEFDLDLIRKFISDTRDGAVLKKTVSRGSFTRNGAVRNMETMLRRIVEVNKFFDVQIAFMRTFTDAMDTTDDDRGVSIEDSEDDFEGGISRSTRAVRRVAAAQSKARKAGRDLDQLKRVAAPAAEQEKQKQLYDLLSERAAALFESEHKKAKKVLQNAIEERAEARERVSLARDAIRNSVTDIEKELSAKRLKKALRALNRAETRADDAAAVFEEFSPSKEMSNLIVPDDYESSSEDEEVKRKRRSTTAATQVEDDIDEEPAPVASTSSRRSRIIEEMLDGIDEKLIIKEGRERRRSIMAQRARERRSRYNRDVMKNTHQEKRLPETAPQPRSRLRPLSSTTGESAEQRKERARAELEALSNSIILEDEDADEMMLSERIKAQSVSAPVRLQLIQKGEDGRRYFLGSRISSDEEEEKVDDAELRRKLRNAQSFDPLPVRDLLEDGQAVGSDLHFPLLRTDNTIVVLPKDRIPEHKSYVFKQIAPQTVICSILPSRLQAWKATPTHQ